MLIEIEHLRHLMHEVLIAEALTDDEAAILVEDYLDAELRGKVSHGLAAFPGVLADIAARGNPRTIRETACCLSLDGDGESGHLVSRRVLDWAGMVIEGGQDFALAGMRNIRRIASPGSIARLGAEAGMITLILEYGGKAFLAPDGAADPVLSTNPIGIGIPRDGQPLVIDMAVSKKAYYFIAMANAQSRPIPADWAIDSSGASTTDPAQVHAVTPFGGRKGAALALVIEVLAGILNDIDVGKDGFLDCRGVLALFMRPTVFGCTEQAYTNRLEHLLTQIVDTPTVPGCDRVCIPGEHGMNLRQEALQRGTIEISESTYNSLLSLHASVTRSRN